MILEIFTPDQKILSKEIEECTAPGFEGEFGVLPDHAPYFVKIKTGRVKFNEKGEENYLVVSKGFSEVTGEKVTILTERVVFSSKIDFEKINKEKNEAEEKIKGLLQEDEEYEKTIEDLNWAIACIEVAKEGGK